MNHKAKSERDIALHFICHACMKYNLYYWHLIILKLMIWLTEKIEFPSYESIRKDGIIALGGDLHPDRLIYAYQNGIFPWYSEN